MNMIKGTEAAKLGAKTIGVRPEHMTVSTTDGAWKGTVGVAEHLGSDTFCHVHHRDRRTLTLRTAGDAMLSMATRSI